MQNPFRSGERDFFLVEICYNENEVISMKHFCLILLCLLLAGCAVSVPLETQVPSTIPPTETLTDHSTEPPIVSIVNYIETMTTEEKVGQLFLSRYDEASAPEHVNAYHPGGFILFARDFQNETPDSITHEIAALQAVSKIPLLMAVDEEGGSVVRISRYSAFRSSRFSAPRSLYQKGGEELLLKTEAEKSQLLYSLGLNVNVGPVCDITTDFNAFMYSRSLGQDAQTTGALIAKMVQTMAGNHVGSVLKHFPGYGNNVDTHVGIAVDRRSLEALETADLIPFRSGIDAGADAILVSHTIVTALDDSLPASLSPAVLGYLRTEMGFDGVAMTDDLVMEAITDVYGAGEAAVLAVLAGNDLLCATEYVTQYNAVLAAVAEGRIPMERIEEAVYRILRWKAELGLLVL